MKLFRATLNAAIRLRRTLRQLSPNSIVQHTAAQLSWRQNLALDALFSPTTSQTRQLRTQNS